MSLKNEVVGLGARTALAVAMAGVFTHTAQAAPGDLIGDPILVGSAVPTFSNLKIASDATGNVVVVWIDGSGNLVARRYAKDGSPNSEPIQIAAVPGGGTGWIWPPSVAVNATGQFTVVWAEAAKENTFQTNSLYWTADPTTVHAKTFRADGTPISGDVQVASMPYNHYVAPGPSGVDAVAMDDDGDFVVNWIEASRSVGISRHYFICYTQNSGVYARVYSAAGKPKTSKLTVDKGSALNCTVGGSRKGLFVENAAVGMDGSGNFTVVWNTHGDTSRSSYALNSRSYNAQGVANGAKATIATPYEWFPPSIAMNRTGQYVVAWQGNDPSQSFFPVNVYAQSYQANGMPASGTVTLLSDVSSPYIYNNAITGPAVAIDASGNFIASTPIYNRADNTITGSVRAFAYNGTPLSASVLLPLSDNCCSDFTIAMDATGDAMAAFSSFVANAASGSVLLQRVAGP